MATKPAIGSIVWQDLTVPDAAPVREFYERVVGWSSSEHRMDEYSDYNMNLPGSGQTVAGICHAHGSNAKVPPQWLIYIAVENVDSSVRTCRELGGKVIDGPREMGHHKFAVIQDPAGAVAALIGP